MSERGQDVQRMLCILMDDIERDMPDASAFEGEPTSGIDPRLYWQIFRERRLAARVGEGEG